MGTCNISTQNGGGLQAQAVFDDVVLYPSPYMVVTPRGYTNHYYAGSERIASRIGNRCWTITAMDDWENPAPETEAREAFWNIGKEEYPFGDEKEISSPTTNVAFDEDYDQHVQYSCNPIYLPEVDVLSAQDMLKHTINCVFSYQNNAPVYYYHTDHLGSTSWVTDETGSEQQFLAYLPYGEPLMDVHLKTYDGRHGPDDIRYKFTGKERDAETGYDYMEQRYYWKDGGFWLRPDPLMDDNISLSSYAYCNGNPLKYVDPQGMEKITSLNPTLKKDRSIMESAKKFPDHPQILHLWLHAQSTYLTIYDGKIGTQQIDYGNAEKAFANYLASVSELWKEHYDNENALQMIVLHSCYAGQGAESIAQHISGLPAFKDILIVAPTETVNVDKLNNTEINTAKTIKTGPDTWSYDKDENDQIQYGAWKIFLNGSQVNSFIGSSLPVFKDPQRENERYHQELNEK